MCPACADAHISRGDFDVQSRRDHVEVIFERLADPELLVGRLRLVERHRIGGLDERLVILAREFAQCFLRRGERTLRGNHGGRRAVVRGARFLHVGDRDQADFEALLGLLELAIERLQGRFRRRSACLQRRARRNRPGSRAPAVLLRGAIGRLRRRRPANLRASKTAIDPNGTESA
jgi:hypothetical protein